MNMTRLLVLAAALLGAGTSSSEAGQPLSMWQVNGPQSRVYLLGSIHLLRKKDYPLPAAIYDAYRDADKLVMELDMDDMDPVEGQALSNELGLIQDDRNLSDLMGADLYAQAKQLALAAQIPIGLLDRSEPWYAAMNVEIMLLIRMGFNPLYGIEKHLADMAQADGKEILGFETMRQQLQFLDGLSPDAQRELLIQALSEGVELPEIMDSMIGAWRSGDVKFLEENLLADMQKYPELNRVIVIDRNIEWTRRIEELLDDDLDYLIVVGTLHLVGEEGVPKLLEARGHQVTQMVDRQESARERSNGVHWQANSLQPSQISTISKSSFPAPQSGQRQDSGTSFQRVRGGIPDSTSPSSSL